MSNFGFWQRIDRYWEGRGAALGRPWHLLFNTGGRGEGFCLKLETYLPYPGCPKFAPPTWVLWVRVFGLALMVRFGIDHGFDTPKRAWGFVFMDEWLSFSWGRHRTNGWNWQRWVYGKVRYENQVLWSRRLTLILNDAEQYPFTVTRELATWRWPRRFKKTHDGLRVEFEGSGVPTPKGGYRSFPLPVFETDSDILDAVCHKLHIERAGWTPKE